MRKTTGRVKTKIQVVKNRLRIINPASPTCPFGSIPLKDVAYRVIRGVPDGNNIKLLEKEVLQISGGGLCFEMDDVSLVEFQKATGL